MGYYIDFKKISIDELKKKLQSADLLPSHQILKENIDERFNILKAQKIDNVEQLQTSLKTKGKLEAFSKITSLPIDYLTILKREINSYHPQPREIKDFACLSNKVKDGLAKLGIKTTVNLYDRISTKSERNKLKNELNISDDEALLLVKITDLSRLRYVNHTFATLLVNSDYDTVEKVKKADYQELHEKLMKLNDEKCFFKGKIGKKDMKFLVEDPFYSSGDIEY